MKRILLNETSDTDLTIMIFVEGTILKPNLPADVEQLKLLNSDSYFQVGSRAD